MGAGAACCWPTTPAHDASLSSSPDSLPQPDIAGRAQTAAPSAIVTDMNRHEPELFNRSRRLSGLDVDLSKRAATAVAAAPARALRRRQSELMVPSSAR